jgi:hypothetical protein
VDVIFRNAVTAGATPILEPTLQPWVIESQGSTIRSTIAGGSPLGSTGDVSDSTLILEDGELRQCAGMSLELVWP